MPPTEPRLASHRCLLASLADVGIAFLGVLPSPPDLPLTRGIVWPGPCANVWRHRGKRHSEISQQRAIEGCTARRGSRLPGRGADGGGSVCPCP
jgi:hypothetical protein